MLAAVPEDPIDEAVEQWRRHGWDAGDRLRAALSITRVADIIAESSAALLRPFELTPARHEMLSLLYFTRHGELPLSKLSRRLMIHPKSVTTTVDALERLGLVERVAHPSDRRTTLARITTRGREAVEAGTPAIAQSGSGLAAITEDEARTVAAVLRKVRAARGDF